MNVKKSELKKVLDDDYDKKLDEFAYLHAEAIFQFATLDENAISQDARELKKKSKDEPEKVFHMARPGFNDYFVVNGKAMLFMKDRLINIDGQLVFGTALTDIWDDVLPNDLHNEGGVSFKKGKKPEKLVQRALELTSNEGELVLDFFAGSGTTGAVAQKINRKFILIEQMDYVDDVLKERLLKTTVGERTAGISPDINWQGGGSFVYTKLFESANAMFTKQIAESKTSSDLTDIFEHLKTSPDLDYRLNFDELSALMADETVKFADKQKLLLSALDKNLLYYNFSELDDVEVRGLVSEGDAGFNREFYGEV